MTAVVLLGWSGTVLYLLNHAYISLQSQWRRDIYFAGNLLAASCLIISSVAAESWQAVVINGFWALISLLLLAKFNLQKLPISQKYLNGGVALFWLWLIAQLQQQGQFDFAILGWSSTLVFSVAYLLFSAERMAQRRYLLWNAYAALALLPQLWLDQNLPVFALETVWALISLYGAALKSTQVHLID